jgi:hypothetical protein
MGTEEIKFLPTDFEKFADSVQDNAEFNDARLEVRRKLDLLGKAGGEKLSDGVHDFVSTILTKRTRSKLTSNGSISLGPNLNVRNFKVGSVRKSEKI